MHRYSTTLIPLTFPLVRVGQGLNDIVAQAIEKQNLRPKRGDVLALASKVVSICEGRVVRLGDVRVSVRARQLAQRWDLDERLSSIVLSESDSILGGVKGFLLTVKNGILTSNAGVDLKNSPRGTATLWPENPDLSARRLRRFLERRYRARLGVEIVDSRVTPLRLGTVGLAIGISGFQPVLDERRKPDIYGRKIRVTQSNIADDLASSAHMLMGETKERIGAVVLRNAPIQIGEPRNVRRPKLGMERCLILNGLELAERRVSPL